MIAKLAQSSATIGELGEPFDMTKGAVTKHVKALERAGILKRDALLADSTGRFLEVDPPRVLSYSTDPNPTLGSCPRRCRRQTGRRCARARLPRQLR